jgi:5,10-methylene-tetrahydrofolate dehydrogenase/methenyl tetrahydrofolate cyclohydrolase
MARKYKATKPLEPIDVELPVNPYLKAVAAAKAGKDVDMPCAFNHPILTRAAGTIKSMVPLGSDNVQELPDYDIEVVGRSGKTISVKLLANHVQIYHSFTEADEDVTKYNKMRGIK